jgi:glycosyltransferase involved in cell wall biosynthesis
MNLVMLNTDDSKGGAAIASYRLHRGLRSVGVDSHLLVLNKYTDDPTVIGPVQQSRLQRAITYLYTRREAAFTSLCVEKGGRLFSPARCPDNLARRVAAFEPDLVHLLWVNSGFMKIETLKRFKKPVVWTLHDMWPFTGGCHYDDGCGEFRHSCGNCPVLHSEREQDISRQVWERKRRSWREVPITVVVTSHWMAAMAKASSLFRDRRIEVIPNGIDTDKYKPLDKHWARLACGLPHDKYLILFSAFTATSDKRKGNHLLVPALQKLALEGWAEKAELLVIGASAPQNPPDLGMKVHFMGHLQDEISQVLLYSAADVTVAPSVQENLSNTVMESLACGTPVVAFNIGGMPDMIDHRGSGYLAEPYEIDDLANGIKWVLEDNARRDLLCRHARETTVERYALKAVANRYRALYSDILELTADRDLRQP